MAISNPMAALQRHSAIPVARIRYQAAIDAATIADMRLGILFVMAWWSGYAVQAFRELTRVINRLDPEGLLELVVVDTADSPTLENVPQLAGSLLSAAGEAAWIRDGKIVATSGSGFNPRCFDSHTRALLMAPRSCV